MPQKILILGAGCSGIAVAISLSLKGFEVCLVERGSIKRTDLKIGESLPPDAQQVLSELGVWEDFQNAGHLKYYGNKSLWGSPEASYTDFIHHPVGHGWHIDRSVFETMLLEKAKNLGVEILENSSLSAAAFDGSHWDLKLQNEGKEILKNGYAFLIDASGRNSWLARKLGIERLYENQQLALVTFLKTNAPFEDTTSLIETTPEGWWYSTKIPGERIATAFLCKPEKSKRELWGKPEEWWTLVNKAPHTADRINGVKAQLLEPPRFVPADSSILEEVYGEGWVAVGDAAMTYDPISSHGILMAMVSARDASKAIQQYLKGHEDALENYQALLWAAFQHYTQQRTQFYKSERRYKDAAYWQNEPKPVY
ncbi:MAG: 2-polyprenyl-6-methoxyphenol hydroxylase-like FAD-dependent oxidoreductase [Saprospiraceae bacterium]|jgi:2-polyprenyl-6-methoxyphenol hydroxylase-like FAD-dependent oxidoreductase